VIETSEREAVDTVSTSWRPELPEHRPARRRARLSERILRIVGLTLVWLGVPIMVLPFVWMVLSAFKPPEEILQIVPTLVPVHPTLDNFRSILTDYSFGQYIVNSLLVTVGTCIAILISSSMLGFIFAKLPFPGRDLLFLAVLATMILPIEVIALPLLVEFEKIDAVNQLWGLGLPFVIDAFAIYLFRQFIFTIPSDYIDAARVEGLGDFGIYWRVILPLCRPVIAAIAILSFLFIWDQVFWPLVLINTNAAKTVPLGIILLSTQFGPVYNLTMAASTITVGPVLIVFLFFRRQFFGGFMMSGLKG
jgi:multiple sugar transport system permease protein